MKRAAIIDRFATNARCGSPYSSQVSSSVLRIVHISTYTSLAPKKWYMPPSALLVRPPQFTSTWLSQQQKSSSQIAPGQPQLLKRTSLSELHIANGATMVPFAGYLMPVQYNDLSVGQSHQWTREKASLFDVGHMVQHRVSGPGAIPLLEKMTPSSISALEPGHFTLSCFLHSGTGGIVDDTVITRLFDDSYYLVTNATCRQKDLAYIHQQIDSYKVDSKQSNVVWDLHLDRDLIALQGPLSSDILQKVLGPTPGADLRRLYFGQCKVMSMDIPGKSIGGVIISRGGYTGEDGFELSILSTDVVQVAEHLLKSAGTDRLRLAGLGARDSLRLEAGMCLYGHDLDDDTTPVEAGLSWIVHRDRRANGGFHGAETILRQVHPTTKGGGPPRRRVGLIVEGAPAREGAEILTVEDAKSGETKVIGKVTSGCPSPTLGQNIAMGYIDSGWHKAGTKVGVLVRGKRRKAVVVKMPFVKSRYWKRPVIMPPG